ncbi:MAG: hypothetical protein WD894_08320 [Pirellulales bacterium]
MGVGKLVANALSGYITGKSMEIECYLQPLFTSHGPVTFNLLR